MDEKAKADRRARRRAAARARLIEAALAVMADKGVDGATIQAITDAADVGFGTFYNHFSSKDAVCEAVVERVIVPWTEALQAMGTQMADPAEILAAAVRHSLRRAIDDPPWGWFVLRTGPWMLRSRVRQDAYLVRTIRAGIAAGRFRAEAPDVAVNATMGILLANLQAMLLGHCDEASPMHVATLCLRMLGIDADEATAIARLDLPPAPIVVHG